MWKELLWKGQFWSGLVYLLLSLCVSIFTLEHNNYTFISAVIVAVVGGFLLLPYYGYAYKTPILKQMVWKVLFFFQVVFLILFLVMLVGYLYLKLTPYDFVLAIAIGAIPFLIVVGLLIAPYCYAFKSDGLWTNAG